MENENNNIETHYDPEDLKWFSKAPVWTEKQIEEERLRLASESKLLKFLKGEKWVLITFLSITLGLIVHTASLVYMVSTVDIDPIWKGVYSFVFAIGFDSAILFFALRGKEHLAGRLALMAFFTNLCFFNYAYLTRLIGDDITHLVVTVLLCATASFVVHSYAVFFNSISTEEDEKIKLFSEIDKLTKDLGSAKSESRKAKIELEKLSLERQKSEAAWTSKFDEVNSQWSEKVIELENKHEESKANLMPLLSEMDEAKKNGAKFSKVKISCQYCSTTAVTRAQLENVQKDCSNCKLREAALKSRDEGKFREETRKEMVTSS